MIVCALMFDLTHHALQSPVSGTIPAPALFSVRRPGCFSVQAGLRYMVLAFALGLSLLGCSGGAGNSTNVQGSFPVSIFMAGNGNGTVTSSPVGLNCSTDCSASVPTGANVTLDATPAPNAKFMGWSGDCYGTTNCLITVDTAKSITATFSRIQFTLAVTVNGSGQGTLNSTPSGIDCGSNGTSCSGQFDGGSNVTLTPVILQGSTFGGWSNECSGIGTCTVSMAAARNVGATFNLIRYAVTVSLDSSGSGLVQSQPQGIVCGQTCFANFESGQSVTLTATPAAGFAFSGWSGDCTGTGSCNIANITAAHAVTAHFVVSTQS
jgi:hypothetical protein